VTATIEQARDDIHARFKTDWDANPESTGILVLYRDRGGEVPDAQDVNGNPNAYARITVQHVAGIQPTVGSATGQRRFRNDGFVTVQIFTAGGTGEVKSDRLIKVAQDAFRGKRTPQGVIFRDVSVNEIGESGDWFQANVTALFEYDEIV
jgi:hypothetical protein